MIPIEYYSTFYIITLAFAVLSMSLPLITTGSINLVTANKYNWFSIFLLLITVLFIGLRDPLASSLYLGDTGAYTRMFTEATLPTFETSKDFGFDLFMFLSSRVMTVQSFYLLCAVLYVGLPYLAFRKWFRRRAWLALIVYVTAMSFWAFGINGLRNGLGAAFFIYGISFVKQPVKMAFWFILAVSFHKSMLLPIIAFIVTKYVKNTNILIWIWLLAIPVAFFFGNSLERLISSFFDALGLVDKRIDSLFVDEIEGIRMDRSFRLDFILYSSVAVFLGYYYVVKRRFRDVLYIRMLNTYLLSNTVWIFMIYAAYTNRTAYLSWFLMPVILIYPLLRKIIVKRQILMIFMIILGSLMFTLIMHFL